MFRVSFPRRIEIDFRGEAVDMLCGVSQVITLGVL